MNLHSAGMHYAGSGVLVIGFLMACWLYESGYGWMESIEMGIFSGLILFITFFASLIGFFFYKWYRDFKIGDRNR